MLKSILYKPDSIGSIASILCLIHCIATPFIFITQACAVSCCSDAPTWWKSIDYIFLVIAFFAILKSTKTSSNKIIKIALWTTFFIFFVCLVGKGTQLFLINQNVTYATGITLGILHLYNLKYCQCDNGKCCANHHH